MTPDAPDSAQVFHLPHQAEGLEREGRHVLIDLKLMAHLAAVGDVAQIGSSTLGLMVWRDLDFSVISPGLSAERLSQVMSSFVAHPKISQVRLLNERGSFNPTGLRQDERYYLAVHYIEGKVEWKIDISFWLCDVPRPEVKYAESIRKKLTHETRMAILWIKDVWHRLPTYRREVGSMDIYTAVLDHDVRTPTQFEAYLAKAKPGGLSR